jgi:beta-phosphoglucomutase
MLKAVIFDYNGVLLNDLEYQIESYWKAARDSGFTTAKATVRRYISYPPAQKKDLFFKKISDTEWKAVFDLKEQYYYQLIDQKKLLFPEVEKLLPSLAGHFALALVSNTVRSLFERTFPRNLADLFQVTLFANEVNAPKPSPQPLLNIVEILGIRLNECCYVGDAIEDIRMAKAAGVRIFSVATGVCSREALIEAGTDTLVANLKELSYLIESG